MLILSQITDTLQIVLGGSITTNHCQAYASWRDITTTAFTPGRSVGVTNNTTAVNLVAAPGASTQRVIDTISVNNNDTANVALTVRFNANGTTYDLWKGTLMPGEHLEYIDGTGFRLMSARGTENITQSLQTFLSPVTNTFNTVVLGTDVTNADATANTLADVTGLSFSVVNGQTFWFRFSVIYTAAIATTGSRFTINGPATSMLAYTGQVVVGAGSITITNANALQLPAAANATSLLGENMALLEGFIRPAADGTVQLQFASEVSSSAIVAKAGSLLTWMRTL